MSRHIPNAYDLIQQLRDTAQYHRAKAAEYEARADRLAASYVPDAKRSIAISANSKRRALLALHARRRVMGAGE
jgi:hypothetical protein